MRSDPGPSRVLNYPAAQLFVVSARAVRPGNPLPEPDLEAVGRISRALGGMPLALELAAARAASVADMPSARPRAEHRRTVDCLSPTRTAAGQAMARRVTESHVMAIRPSKTSGR